MDEYYTKDEVDNLLANLKGEIDKKFIEEDIKIEDVRKNSAITLTYDTKENGCNGGNDNYCKDSVIRVCGNVYYDKNYFSYSFTTVSKWSCGYMFFHFQITLEIFVLFF